MQEKINKVVGTCKIMENIGLLSVTVYPHYSLAENLPTPRISPVTKFTVYKKNPNTIVGEGSLENSEVVSKDLTLRKISPSIWEILTNK